LPDALSWASAVSSASVSAGCRPADGSSSSARHQVFGDALGDDQFFRMTRRLLRIAARAAVGVRAQDRRQPFQRQARNVGDVMAGEGHRQRFAAQPLAPAQRTLRADHVAGHALFHRRALGGGEGLQHILARAGEGALVAGRFLALERLPDFGGREAGVHRRGRLLVGEEDPLAVFFRQVAPRRVDVVAERDEDVAQVLAVPGGRPGRHRALADGEAVVRHHRRFGHLVDPAQAMAFRAGAFRRVGRKRFGVQQLLAGGIVAGARVQHAQRIGQGADAADRGTGGGRASLLLQCHRRRQADDVVDVGHRHLVEQPARVGRDRFEVAPLRLGVQGAEGERGLAGAGHAGKHHQRVARDVERDVFQVVFACSADPDKSGRRRIMVVAHPVLAVQIQ
jgi:hypothetical protein